MKKLVRGSIATYRLKSGPLRCDLDELARIYQNYGNVPSTLTDTRAMEIALLAQAYLIHELKSNDEFAAGQVWLCERDDGMPNLEFTVVSKSISSAVEPSYLCLVKVLGGKKQQWEQIYPAAHLKKYCKRTEPK